MEEFDIQGKQTSFYKYCPGTFGYILVYAIIYTVHIIWKYIYNIYYMEIIYTIY